jgi:hypothetical protein
VILGILGGGTLWLVKQIVWQYDLQAHVQEETVVNRWQTYGMLRLEAVILKHELDDCSAKRGSNCSDISEQLADVKQRAATAHNEAMKRQ